MIDDDELRSLYQVSSEEHIQKLEEGILLLEKNPDDHSPFTDLMREAHSLKGDSRMLGVDGVEVISHKIEDILGAIKTKDITLTSDLSDRLYQGLDALRKLVHEAVTGEDSQVNVEQFMSYLQGENVSVINPEMPPETVTENQELVTNITANEETLILSAETDNSPPIAIDHQALIQEHLKQIQTDLEQFNAQTSQDQTYLAKLHQTCQALAQEATSLNLKNIFPLLEQIKILITNLQTQKINFNQTIKERITEGIKGIESLIHEAITGTPSNINTFHLLAYLMGANSTPHKTDYPEMVESDTSVSQPPVKAVTEAQPLSTPTPTTTTPTTAKPTTTTPTTTTPTTAKPLSHSKIQASPAFAKNDPMDTPAVKMGEPYHIDTIRVKTSHLDALMTQTGELTVTKIRIAHTTSEIEEALNLWEEWKNNRRGHNLTSYQAQMETDQINEERLDRIFQHLRNSASENSTRLEIIATELEDKIKTLRLLPLATVFGLFPRMVRDLAKQEGKQIELIIEGGETSADKQILEEIKDPLMHMIRNAVDHGIETPAERKRKGKPPVGTIHLTGYQTASSILIEVKDDGKGLDLKKIKETALSRGLYSAEELATMSENQLYNLVLAPGFSTRKFITEVSGRGVGLDVVNTNVERLKGNINITSTPDQGCTFTIQLGTTLATANVLLVDIQGIIHAIPIEFVQTTFLIAPDQIFTIEGRETIALNNQAISVAHLADLLEFAHYQGNLQVQDHQQKELLCILLTIGTEKLGVFVDGLLDTQDVVIKPQSLLLKRVRNVAGATILGTGEVCMILNPLDLLKTIQKKHSPKVALPSVQSEPNRSKIESVAEKRVVLLAEDSIATRTQEKRILESAGYEVVTAVDGLDGFNKLKTRTFDAVISDIQMPNMDGLTLTEKIRQLPQYNELPIILVTSLASDEDKRRGAEAGANAYITKDRFNQEILIETLNRLV